MATKRKVEVFSAGCPICEETVETVRAAACPSCEVVVHDMHTEKANRMAGKYGVKSIPAVAINGKLAGCCSARGVDLDALKPAGLGQPT